MIKSYKNLLPINIIQKMWFNIEKSPWWLDNYSLPSENASFLSQHILFDGKYPEEYYQLIKNTKLLVESDLGREIYPLKVRVNGQFFGQDGTFHKDMHYEGCYTLVFFPMLNWNTEWGGELIIYDNKDYAYIQPFPNTGTIFPSHFDHVGMAPKRICKNIRVSVAINFSLYNNEDFLKKIKCRIIEI